MPRLLIIGGSDAGIMAGLRARQLDPELQVRLFLADRFPNFSICGLPFYISGETPDWRSLAIGPWPTSSGPGCACWWIPSSSLSTPRPGW